MHVAPGGLQVRSDKLVQVRSRDRQVLQHSQLLEPLGIMRRAERHASAHQTAEQPRSEVHPGNRRSQLISRLKVALQRAPAVLDALVSNCPRIGRIGSVSGYGLLHLGQAFLHQRRRKSVTWHHKRQHALLEMTHAFGRDADDFDGVEQIAGERLCSFGNHLVRLDILLPAAFHQQLARKAHQTVRQPLALLDEERSGRSARGIKSMEGAEVLVLLVEQPAHGPAHYGRYLRPPSRASGLLRCLLGRRNLLAKHKHGLLIARELARCDQALIDQLDRRRAIAAVEAAGHVMVECGAVRAVRDDEEHVDRKVHVVEEASLGRLVRAHERLAHAPLRPTEIGECGRALTRRRLGE
mmetsp:Transcript_50473/g.167168  ORF Transcript_50473/g.167168 Transcript_50473/m.167168 type:complete len:353 (+) Transcript_50473:1458-2516(+)